MMMIPRRKKGMERGRAEMTQLELSMFEITRRGLSTRSLLKSLNCLMSILEVLDARDPLGSRCTDMERMVMQAGPNKHLVLLLNKIDLVLREAAEKWLKYLREEFPAVALANVVPRNRDQTWVGNHPRHQNQAIFCRRVIVLKLCSTQMLVTLYKIPSFESVDDFLYKVATVRGKLKKGGLVDIGAAARIVLHHCKD
ncbi:hypothetical protein EUTSA_v10014729mg [Eutrema salsugineum]|uniref:G domain-containing protein n=1 Tax=Eutrema salsugineum TaxID=72664 RepID=V4KT58_EUTSA|nr:hypothetical protein EUTSA_v10014729mg [Eutrema salsugineum]